MGCRTYFREGGLVVPKTGTTLEEMRQALSTHLDRYESLEDLLGEVALGLGPLNPDVIDVRALPDNPERVVLEGDYEDDLGPRRIAYLEEALKVIAPFVEPLPNTYLTYSDDEGACWRYIVRDGVLMTVYGEIVYDEAKAEAV